MRTRKYFKPVCSESFSYAEPAFPLTSDREHEASSSFPTAGQGNVDTGNEMVSVLDPFPQRPLDASLLQKVNWELS